MKVLDARSVSVCGLKNFKKGITERPYELGYRCPKCGKTLAWSIYDAMIWCRYCNLDIPACMCKEKVEEGIYEYLDSV